MTITRDNIIETLKNIFPFLKNEIESAAGVYEALGNVAIFLGEGIEKQDVDESVLQKAIQLIDELASHDDPEMKNMLVAGIFETLSNYEYSMAYLKQKIGSEGNQLFEKYLL